jgi:hypothetical protein
MCKNISRALPQKLTAALLEDYIIGFLPMLKRPSYFKKTKKMPFL